MNVIALLERGIHLGHWTGSHGSKKLKPITTAVLGIQGTHIHARFAFQEEGAGAIHTLEGSRPINHGSPATISFDGEVEANPVEITLKSHVQAPNLRIEVDFVFKDADGKSDRYRFDGTVEGALPII